MPNRTQGCLHDAYRACGWASYDHGAHSPWRRGGPASGHRHADGCGHIGMREARRRRIRGRRGVQFGGAVRARR